MADPLTLSIGLEYPEDVTRLLSIKLAAIYALLREVECIRTVARAHQNRNLADFEKALKDYKNGAYFSLLLFPLLTVVSYRAPLGSDDPLPPRRTVRYPRTESVPVR